jgi:peptidoglycan/xylan/chitin deacetylase (PgdA/CDA1 family)
MDRRQFLAAALALPTRAPEEARFAWPRGKRAAISLTFDDARLSQIDTGIPLLERCGVRATFYVSQANLMKRLEGWKKAVAAGHEIGNHSQTHACTGNYRFSRSKALEDFTEARMEADLDGASQEIEKLLGVKPVSFAYPCGQKFVGRGEQTRSYVPLVAKRFLSGRGYLDEAANDPEVCDLAQLMGTGFDGLSYEEMRKLVETAAGEGRWLVFVGHEIGRRAWQTTDAEALERLCRYAMDPVSGLWIDTVEKVARHVKAARAGA